LEHTGLTAWVKRETTIGKTSILRKQISDNLKRGYIIIKATLKLLSK
jgi:hypothetical protein